MPGSHPTQNGFGAVLPDYRDIISRHLKHLTLWIWHGLTTAFRTFNAVGLNFSFAILYWKLLQTPLPLGHLWHKNIFLFLRVLCVGVVVMKNSSNFTTSLIYLITIKNPKERTYEDAETRKSNGWPMPLGSQVVLEDYFWLWGQAY